jgi:predicted DCC family thiol-disulfide oxidoreductase YuxK
MDFHHHLERAVRRAPSLDRESLARAVHLLSPEGEVWMGFEAVRRLARLFPALWPLLPVLHAPGASRTGRVLYEWIARNRYRLGGCGPDAACHARFRRPGKPA